MSEKRLDKSLGFAVCCGLLAMLAVASPGLAAGSAGAACPSAQAWAWVNANRDHLPTQAGELALYPAVQRMAIVASLDPANRSRLWREHFQRHLDRDANLTSVQRAVLADAKTLFSPAMFADRSASKALVERDLPQLLERAVDAFGPERGVALLTVIDPTPEPVLTPHCSCATSPGDTCGSKRYCDDTATCTVSERGCGPGGVYACNGQCASVEPVPVDPTTAQ
jgi:hypothetical protein